MGTMATRTRTHESPSATATATTTAVSERLWSIEDLSDFLGVPVYTIHRWRKTGGGPRSYKGLIRSEGVAAVA